MCRSCGAIIGAGQEQCAVCGNSASGPTSTGQPRTTAADSEAMRFPVIASMGSVAASGGYFVAMPADVIVAQPGTITGSIGVLTGKGVVRDALARIGISQEAVSRGRERADVLGAGGVHRRAVGAAGGDPRPHLQGFVAKAAQDRGLPEEQLEALARGRVWTGADAHCPQTRRRARRLPARPHARLQPRGARPRRDRAGPTCGIATFWTARAPTTADDLAVTSRR